MAAMELNFNTISHDGETQTSESSRKHGGWIAFPFIAGALVGLTLAVAGSMTNMIVYFIEKFHMKNIQATQIGNIVNGCSSLLPLISATIADSFLGCFSVVWISAIICLLGTILLTLTATLPSLRPGLQPSSLQLAVLYSGVALVSLGQGGSRYILSATGADQFEKPKDQETFIHWYVVILYGSAVTGATVIVYVEDNVSWALGFGLCIAATIIGLSVLLLGSRCYRQVKPHGSPFTSLARAVVAAFWKKKLLLSSKTEDYYYGNNGAMEIQISQPTKSFRFLNRAAQKTEGDIRPDGSAARPWRLCSVQQVEDLKTLIRIFPLLSSAIFISTPIAVLSSLTILQALTVDRHLGKHFRVPAGSMIVFILISTTMSIAFVDRVLYPIWQKLTSQSPTPLQRIGVGHFFNMVGMAVAALVESKRLKIARTHELVHHVVPMSVLWLVPQLAVVGFGEAFHYPGQVTLYYQEFPKSLGSTATAMISLIMGIAYYLSTALIDLIQRVTTWLPDDINKGRLDLVHWMLFVLGILNFRYFMICAKFYKYQNVSKGNPDYNSNK